MGRGRLQPQGVAAAMVFLATVALYWPVHNHQFIFLDDPVYLTKNTMIGRGLTLEGIRWAFTSIHYASNWFPLTWLSHMLDVQLFGLTPGGHHIMSVVFHAMSSALLFLVFRAMTGTSGRGLAVALLFAFHPLRVESVAWAAERKDVLSALFWMLTLLAYARWARQPRPGRYVTAVVVYALGLMTKPMLVSLPFVLLLLDFWPLGRLRLAAHTPSGAPRSTGATYSRLLIEKLPFLALAAGASAMTLIAQANAIQLVQERPFTTRIFNAIHSYGAYLGKTFWPADLLIFYPYSESALRLPKVIAIAMLLAVITSVAVVTIRSRPYLLTGWFWYLGSLFPVIGLVQSWNQAMADRFTYLPQIGVLLALVWSVPELLPLRRRRGRVFAMITAAACISLAAVTTRHLRTMKDDESLYRHMISVAPTDWQSRFSLGTLLIKRGEFEEGTALLRSVEYRLDPQQLTGVLLQTAGQFSLSGDTARALLYFTKVLQLDPDNGVALRAVAGLKAHGPPPPRGESASWTVKALVDEQESVFWLREGDALASAGHCALALERYRHSLGLNPGSADAWNNLGGCYGKLHRVPEAAAAFEKALAVDPGHQKARQNLKLSHRLLGR